MWSKGDHTTVTLSLDLTLTLAAPILTELERYLTPVMGAAKGKATAKASAAAAAPMDATENVIQASADAMATLSAMEALLVEGASPSPDDLGNLVNAFVTNLHVLHESGNETVSVPNPSALHTLACTR